MFGYIISNYFNFSWVSKGCYKIFMMSAKMATPDLFKIKVFWKKGYEVIISVHNLANKSLSRDSNYIGDVVISPKFGNSSTSMREVIITSIS